MLFSRWIIAAAFGLACSGSLKAQEQQGGSNGGASYQKNQTDNSAFSALIGLIEGREAAAASEREKEERRQREIDDLVAQQGMNAATQAMNRATQSMKNASWVSTGLIGFGTIVLIWTLWLTRQANLSAQQAVTVTERIGRAQVRSYVYVTDVEVDHSQNMLVVSFRNFGNSPCTVSFVDCTVLAADPYKCETLWSQRLWSDGFSLAPHDTVRERYRLNTGRSGYLIRMIERDGILVSAYGKFQTVDVFKSKLEGGFNITMSDGVLKQ